MIDTILFDLDNTLLDFSKAERIALAESLRRVDVEPKDHILRRYSAINQDQWRLLETGKLTRPQVKLRRFELLFAEFGLGGRAAEAAEQYEKLLEIGHYFVDGAEELLTRLNGKYRLYMVTNGTTSVQKSRIKSARLDRFFDEYFISEEIGYDKPGLAYFTYCFSHIPEFARERTVIVGDSLTSDIRGGKNAGIHTIWYNPTHQSAHHDLAPDDEIGRLDELDGLLLQL